MHVVALAGGNERAALRVVDGMDCLTLVGYGESVLRRALVVGFGCDFPIEPEVFQRVEEGGHFACLQISFGCDFDRRGVVACCGARDEVIVNDLRGGN